MNTPQGTVVGQAQGDPTALQTLYARSSTLPQHSSPLLITGWCRRKWLQEEGSPKSRIDRCEFKNERDDLPALEFSSFGVKRPSRKKREESGSEKRKSREVAPSKEAGERKKKKKKEKTKKDEDDERSKVKKEKKEKKKKTKESA
jgi:hypothetical protein